jgi:hypothetical protein
MLRALLLLFALIGILRAQELMLRETFDPATDTHVEITALFSRPSPSGYLPVRVKIANNLKTDHAVRLNFDSGTSIYDQLHTKTRFDLGAAAGKVVTQDLLVPLSADGSSSSYPASGRLDLRLSGSLGDGFHTLAANWQPDQPAVLLSESLFTPHASTLDSEILSKLAVSYGGPVEFAAKFDPKQLPDNWLAFSGYDSVVMTDTDWSNIPPGGRNAILSWVRLGGQLLVYAAGSPTPSALGLPDEAGFGSTTILPFVLGAFDAKGLVHQVTSENPNQFQQRSIRSDYQSKWPLQAHFGSQTFHYVLFVVVLVVFAILVGPINLFVFAKSGQRHKLFFTTPLISLGASLVLIVLIIVQDGFGGKGMRRVLMEVRPDAGVNAAFIHQEQFCRTGLLTGSAFELQMPALVRPVPIAKSRWARFTLNEGAKGNFNLQPSDGKFRATGDWFQSRSEHGHILSAVVSTRGRIEKTDAENTFLSTFEYPIETLYFLDSNGLWHRASGIEAGKRFSLVATDATLVEAQLKKEFRAYGSRDAALLKKASQRPGHFIALTPHAPGIDTHPGIDWRETRTVITGPVM